MPRPFRIRDVVESTYFSAAIVRIFGGDPVIAARLADEGQMFAIAWALAREDDWTRYPAIQNTSAGPLRVLKSSPTLGCPGLVVYFTVAADDESVMLHDVLPVVA